MSRTQAAGICVEDLRRFVGGLGQPRSVPVSRLLVKGPDGTHFIEMSNVRNIRADAHGTQVHDGTRERICPWSISEAEADMASPTEMTATVVIKIGPVKATFGRSVTLSELDPANSYRITGEGAGGVAVFGKGWAVVRLEDQGLEATILHYSVEVQVGGKLAQLDARPIDSTAKKLTLELSCPSETWSSLRQREPRFFETRAGEKAFPRLESCHPIMGRRFHRRGGLRRPRTSAPATALATHHVDQFQTARTRVTTRNRGSC